jgi:hypothetical protein
LIPATEWDSILAELESPDVAHAATEGEVFKSSLANVMSTPPGPLKCNTRVWWTERCPSGPFEGEEPN